MNNKLKYMSLILVAGLFSACGTKEPIPMMDDKPSEITDRVISKADTDRDGVLNTVDFCPRTVDGANVDSEGCIIKNTVKETMNMGILLRANFDVDKATIKTDDKKEIQKYITYLKKYSNAKIVIEGHTDSTASEKYNESLAARRALRVKDMIVSGGIDSNRIRVESYGETQPVIDNKTAEHMAQNRRAISKIIR